MPLSNKLNLTDTFLLPSFPFLFSFLTSPFPYFDFFSFFLIFFPFLFFGWGGGWGDGGMDSSSLPILPCTDTRMSDELMMDGVCCVKKLLYLIVMSLAQYITTRSSPACGSV